MRLLCLGQREVYTYTRYTFQGEIMKQCWLLLGVLALSTGYSLAIHNKVTQNLTRLSESLQNLQTALSFTLTKKTVIEHFESDSESESSAEATQSPNAPPAPPIFGGPGAPPPPPAIGITSKPIIAKPSLPILTAEELAHASDQEKKRSDAVFLSMLKDLASTEYVDTQRFEQVVRKAIKDVRNESNFLKRKELDGVLDPKMGLFTVLKKDFSSGNNERLVELYDAFTKVKPEILLGSLLELLKRCLFDAALLSTRDVELFVISSIVSQRLSSNAQDEAAQNASDAVFILAWNAFAKDQEAVFAPENAFNSLVRSLNFLRINPAFLKYEDMLWKGVEGSESRKTQKSKNVSPLLVFLMNPTEFIQRAETGVTELKRNAARYLFDLSLYENTLSSNSLKSGLTWQLLHTKQQIFMSLADFVRGRLQKATTLNVLQSILKSILQVYQGKLGEQEALVKRLQAEFENPSLDSSKIVHGFAQLAGSLPESLSSSLKELIDSESRDKQIVALVIEAAKDRPHFQERIVAATIVLPELQAQFKTAYANLYRTPRDIFTVISRAVKNKKLLTDNGIKAELFYELVKPYGILLYIFDYYVKRYQLVKDDPAKVKLNIDMLIESLQAISNPKKYFSPGSADDKKIKNLKQAAAKSIENKRALLDLAVAPVLLDIIVNDQLLGTSNAGYYSDQLSSTRNVHVGKDILSKAGIYENLDPLIKMVKEYNGQGVVDYITAFVNKAEGVDVRSAQFTQLMDAIKTALAGSALVK